jgi:hypothetical protein
MQRRTFLKSALAVPLLGITASPAAVIAAVPAEWEGQDDWASGWRPTDAVSGALPPRTILCVNYPPGAGKAFVLLDQASRICQGYPVNVILAGTDGSVIDVRQHLARRVVPPRDLLAHSEPLPYFDAPRATWPGVPSVDSHEMDRVAAIHLVIRLMRKPLLGHSLLVHGEWSTLIDHDRPFRNPCIPQRVEFKLWAAGLAVMRSPVA